MSMRVLTVHNRYQLAGGEDVVFATETTVLLRYGNVVTQYIDDNRRISKMNPMMVPVRAIWSRETGARLACVLSDPKPHVAHFHNTFPLISPSAYYACKRAGVPVVQTLHNFRLLCPGATLYRKSSICEDCVGRGVPWPGMVRGCWRGSRAQTAVVAAMLTFHRWLGTWHEKVDIYVALTEFARGKLVEGGLPSDKIVVKPNFIYPDPGPRERKGEYVLFVGRLSPEKGIRTLLKAWRRLGGIPLKIVGDGPLMEEIRTHLGPGLGRGVEALGRQNREQVLELMKGARFLVFPSEWYEGFPMTIVEAFACGVPVITSRLGAMAEIVEDGRTGLHFTAGDPEHLAAKVEWAWTHPKQMAEMGREARREYEAKYTAERNYQMLMEIYRLAIERAKGRC